MRSTHRLKRQYDQLQPAERFRLFVHATGRDDEQEAARLVISCPTQPYTLCDPRFQDPVELAREFTLVLLAELGPLLGRLVMLRALAHTTGFFLEAATDAASTAAFAGSPPELRGTLPEAVRAAAQAPGIRFLRVLAELEKELSGRAAGVAHGFAAFSANELELDAETLLAAFARPFLDDYRFLLDSESDPEHAAMFETALIAYWRWRLHKEPLPPGLDQPT